MVAKPKMTPVETPAATATVGASGAQPPLPPAAERAERLAAAHKRVLEKFAPTFAKLAE
jgi:hypothetical protein